MRRNVHKTEPNRNVAHVEETNFLRHISNSSIYFLKSGVFKPVKKTHKLVTAPTCREKQAKSISDSYLLTNFALYNSHFMYIRLQFTTWTFTFEGFTSHLRPIILLWINFQGHDEPLKMTKIRLLKILTFVSVIVRLFISAVFRILYDS